MRKSKKLLGIMLVVAILASSATVPVMAEEVSNKLDEESNITELQDEKVTKEKNIEEGIVPYSPGPLVSYSVEGGNIYFRMLDLNEDGTWTGMLCGYDGPITKVDFPSVIQGILEGDDKPVTIHVIGIDPTAFLDCATLESVTLPDSITTIGSQAFSGCSSLTSITIPDGVEIIESSLFFKCNSLTNVIIPDSVTTIEGRAFGSCTSLTSIEIPDTVTAIEGGAFNNCEALKSITIPDGVTSIGDATFGYCSSLTNITIPDSVTSIGERAFDYCSALKSIIIPDSVTMIGNRAFAYCRALENITMPSHMTNIGKSAFYSCVALKSIEIPDGIIYIEDSAFTTCGLTSVTIPNSVTSIGTDAFWGCKFTDISIPDSVTDIGNSAFDYCDLLKDVYYSGTKAQWDSIVIASGNDPLTSATIHYKGDEPTQDIHTITVPSDITGGSVTSSVSSAKFGDTVILSVMSDSGYSIESVTVTNEAGKEITLNNDGDGKYSFTMPDTNGFVKNS